MLKDKWAERVKHGRLVQESSYSGLEQAENLKILTQIIITNLDLIQGSHRINALATLKKTVHLN